MSDGEKVEISKDTDVTKTLWKGWFSSQKRIKKSFDVHPIGGTGVFSMNKSQQVGP